MSSSRVAPDMRSGMTGDTWITAMPGRYHSLFAEPAADGGPVDAGTLRGYYLA